MTIIRLMPVLLALSLAFGASTFAEDAPLVDGNLWTVSSEQEKEAYLIGAGNFMTVEYIVQSKADTAPTENQSAISRWYDALEATTVNEVVATVDSWYASNPGKMSTPVLVVIWNSYVENE